MNHERTFTIRLFSFNGVDSINGVLKEDKESGYTIAINRDKSKEIQFAAFLHEMAHIYNGDFEKVGNVQEIESKTHAMLLQALHYLESEGKA